MSDEAKTGVAEFVQSKVVVRFDQAMFDAQSRLAEAQRKLETAQREFDDIRSAQGTMRWEIDGFGTWYLNIADGKMTVAEAPADAPFITLVMAQSDWDRFASGAVPSGLMPGNRQQQLGKSRIQRIKGLKGLVRFVVTGLPDGDFSTLVQFGPDPRPAAAQTTIKVGADVAAKLQAGELNPQMAFMQGQIRLEGDAGLAMQVGMAMAM